MSYEDASFALEDPYPVGLQTLAGATVTVAVRALATDVERVVLHGTIALDDWRRAVALGAFHSDLETGALPGADSVVEVTLVLRSPMMGLFDDGEAVLAALFGDEPTPLRLTESWLLGSAMQSVEVPDSDGATSSSGYRTRWAPPLY